MTAAPAAGAVYQWSAPVRGVLSAETYDNPRAYLWIPPACPRVRAVVVGEHNLLEEPLLESPRLRARLEKLCIAEVWTTPVLDTTFDFNNGAGAVFTGMMQDLADASGYAELAYAPVVPVGESALASYPWNFAAWAPERTLAVISLKGDAPQTDMTGSGKPNPDWGARTLDGVPGLMTLRSKSVLGLSSVQILFERGSDVIRARQMVGERIAQVQPRLPLAARQPVLMPPLSSTSRAMKVGLSSTTRICWALKKLASFVLAGARAGDRRNSRSMRASSTSESVALAR